MRLPARKIRSLVRRAQLRWHSDYVRLADAQATNQTDRARRLGGALDADRAALDDALDLLAAGMDAR